MNEIVIVIGFKKIERLNYDNIFWMNKKLDFENVEHLK